MLRRLLVSMTRATLWLITLRLAVVFWWHVTRHLPSGRWTAAWSLAERGLGQTLQRIITISVGGAPLANHSGDRR